MVILEEETKAKFGYYSTDWAPKSHKSIIVACDECGKARVVRKSDYRLLCRTCTRKGERQPNFGKSLSKAQRQKMSDAHKGEKAYWYNKHFSKEHKRKIGDSRKGDKNAFFGRVHSIESKQKMRDAQKGKRHTQETRKKMSNAQKGDKNHQWRGGLSFGEYCPKFNNAFKEYIRDKFDRKCFLCCKTEVENGQRLCVHHVNYLKSCLCNGEKICQFIPLCKACHSKVHHNRDKWENFFLNKLHNNLNGWYI